MIRPRGATTRRRDDQQKTGPSALEIGQQLRSAREERGLDLLAVHDRLSRPITQIEALENGDLGRLHDRDVATSTLRRYATFLGLDGETLVGQLSEAWPAEGPTRNGDDTGTVAATAADPNATRALSVQADPEHLRAFTQTGEVPRYGVAPRSPANGSGPDTGTFPVVPRGDLRSSRRAVARARRRLRAPSWLKVVTGVAVVGMLLVTAGWAIRTWNPQWLIRAHILRTTTHPGSPNGSTPGTAAPVNHQQAAVQIVAQNPSGAAYVVSSPHFNVTLATTGRVWIRVISSASSVPLLQGVQSANQVFSYKANGTMTVTIGASPVVVGVSVKGKAPFLDKPSVAPFTYTFTPPKSG